LKKNDLVVEILLMRLVPIKNFMALRSISTPARVIFFVPHTL
jgi:hypothetical protein